MEKFGVFDDFGLIENLVFDSYEEAVEALDESFPDEDLVGIEVHAICAEHEFFAAEECPDCIAEEAEYDFLKNLPDHLEEAHDF